MRLADTLVAIAEGAEPPEIKSGLIRRAKAQSWLDHLADARERRFACGAVSVSITDVELVHGPHPLVANGSAIVVRMRCERNGVVIRRADEPWIIVNPPNMVAEGSDALGRPRHREDVREAFRTTLTDFLQDRYGG